MKETRKAQEEKLTVIISTEDRAVNEKTKKRKGEKKMSAINMNEMELNMENLENTAGGTPMSIPGGKRSGRKNSETALEILNKVEDLGNSFLEKLGLKQKPVDNSIVDKRLPEDWINS